MPTRRTFLKAVAASSAALTAVPHSQAHVGSTDTLKVGLIGCGGRGTGAADQALSADNYNKLWALADAFTDRLDACHDRLKSKFSDRVDVPGDRRFSGLDAYKNLIDSGVDVILLCTPPAFRPQQLRYAVEKKKHIFCEKPMAVDAPGVRSVIETAKMAKDANLNIVSGFCYRYDQPKRETIKRIHDGAIGDVLAIHTNYLTGYLWSFDRQPDWSDTEYQLRNWLYYTWLSGDHIVEQHIHSLDKAAWVLKDTHPESAVGLAGRQTRVEEKWGNIFDHFSTVFEYANGVKVFSNCRQISGCSTETSDHVIGNKGAAQLMKHTVEPANGSKWAFTGNSVDMYNQEHNELFQAIRSGKPINQGEQMAYSTLLGIMGRMAGYTGRKITWEQALNSSENLMPAKIDLKAAMPFPPIAKPGKTKFI